MQLPPDTSVSLHLIYVESTAGSVSLVLTGCHVLSNTQRKGAPASLIANAGFLPITNKEGQEEQATRILEATVTQVQWVWLH